MDEACESLSHAMSKDDRLCSRDETCEALSSSKGMSEAKEPYVLLWCT